MNTETPEHDMTIYEAHQLLIAAFDGTICIDWKMWDHRTRSTIEFTVSIWTNGNSKLEQFSSPTLGPAVRKALAAIEIDSAKPAPIDIVMSQLSEQTSAIAAQVGEA